MSERLLGLLGGHQHVVVAVPGHDVGADAVARQLGRDGRRQPHRPQARVHPQRDAAEGVRAVKACIGGAAIQSNDIEQFWFEIGNDVQMTSIFKELLATQK